ncbi:Brct domain-containing protein [Colletotrichum higginsianum IMI 349063]|uniref:Brct domain-containing protein n=2 Tax=Colletotrichum higginsianum (strain IMI 349063) TaxID=759273 RepID=A0A1B7YNJ8_COLHI|nr:Brct domain-containing protein [Colletotrichum higginsianum IMI 349063]OBR13637.1 Brct domain-containing protein [Colletotrichum higginsianum IMI 349063]GJC95695.1 brct domain-containing protein [Colletotrichum higginsianum]
MVRAIFRNLVIAAAGEFPSDCPSEQAAKEWAKLRQGRFSSDLDDSVTHLICTNEEFKNKRKNHRIKNAEKDKRKIHIINWDWYRFSCTHNKKLRERDFDFSSTRAKEKERFRKKRELEQRARNSMKGEKWINPDLYHVCTDKSFFEYKIELFRTSEDEDGAHHEKYQLYLFESHAKPHLYWFGVKFLKKRDNGRWWPHASERTSPTPGNLQQQFQQFLKFFELKTSIRWWDRIIKAGTREKIFFNYSPPTRGKPVGGSMKGDMYDKCLKSNKGWFHRWADLFGDDLPADLQIEDAAKKILDDIIDESCAFLEASSLLGDEESVQASQETYEGNIPGASADGKVWDEPHENSVMDSDSKVHENKGTL